METINKFLSTVMAQLKAICEGDYKATDEVLKYSDPKENEPEVVDLAETVGLMSVKLEAREMALERTIAELKENLLYRKEFGSFFIVFTFFIGVFMFVTSYISGRSFSDQTMSILGSVISILFVIFLVGLAATYIKKSSFPVSSFGLTLKGSGRAITESLLATIPMLWLITVFRILFAYKFPALSGRPLIDPEFINYAYLLYFVIAPCQEFIARGLLQSVLYRLLGGKHSAFWSILLASFIFGITHIFYSFWLSVLSALAGIVWGWLYLRHQTIIGVSISHLIVGYYLGFTGLWNELL